MEIRAATPGDVEQILPLVRKICDLHEGWDPARFGFRPDVIDLYRRWLTERATDPRSVLLVAAREGALTGYLVATIEPEIPIYQVSQCAWIHDIFVDEGYRNEGTGRQMTMLAIERFTQLGIRQVRLQTAQVNQAAREMFQSCGFRVATIEMLLEL